MQTAAEITAQASVAFKQFDTNADGKLDQSEARELYKVVVATAGGEFAEDKYQTAWAKMDSNADGFVDESELVAWLIGAAKATGKLQE
jgi:Ca2+-binding EF-hand superfamily protein